MGTWELTSIQTILKMSRGKKRKMKCVREPGICPTVAVVWLSMSMCSVFMCHVHVLLFISRLPREVGLIPAWWAWPGSTARPSPQQQREASAPFRPDPA